MELIVTGSLALILALIVVRWLFFLGPVRSPEPLPTTPIVDIHCHCAGVGAGESGAYLHPKMASSWKFGFYLRGFNLTREDLASGGDRRCIQAIAEEIQRSKLVDKAVVLALDAVYSEDGEIDWRRTVLRVPNSFLAQHLEAYEELLFGASVHPYRKDALKRLEWCKRRGAVVVKWLPAVQLMDPADRRMKEFYTQLQALELPLLTHVGDESSFDRARDDLCDPERLRLPLDMGVRVIAAHVGAAGSRRGRSNFDHTVALMRRYDNLWADISALSLINRKGYLQKVLLESDLHSRLLYGTDFPLTNMPVVSAYYLPLRLRFRQMRQIESVRNSWDRDVLLKQALGVPAEVFAKPARFLGLTSDS